MLSFPQKLPGERVSAQIDFGARLPTGVTVTDGSNSVSIEAVNSTDTSLVLDGPVQRLGAIVGVAIKGGAENVEYIVTFTAKLSDDQIIQEQATLRVVPYLF